MEDEKRGGSEKKSVLKAISYIPHYQAADSEQRKKAKEHGSIALQEKSSIFEQDAR